MRIQDQVCPKELAYKLKELGVKQKSLFYFHPAFDKPVFGETWTTQEGKKYAKTMVCNDKKAAASAFSVSELGIMLPDYTPSLGNLEIGKCETDHITNKPLGRRWWNVSFWTWTREATRNGDIYLRKESKFLHQFPTAAEAYCAMLIYLLENKLTTPEEVNNKLKD